MIYNENEYNGDVLNGVYGMHDNVFLGESTYGEIDNVLKCYENDSEYIKHLMDIFGEFPENCRDVEKQITDLFSNVKNILQTRDTNLIKNCIQSMDVGRRNAAKFIYEQEKDIDSKTLNIMNAIVNEYSKHIDNLTMAINILNN